MEFVMNYRQKITTFAIPTILVFYLVFCNVQLVMGQDPQKELSIGENFYQETSLTWLSVVGDVFSSKPKKPSLYKTYPGVKVIKLPKPVYKGIAFEETIKKRRSVRNYTKKPLNIQQLSQLLFAAQGITGEMYDKPLRSAPSAGALYPIEIYIVVNNVKELSQGIYHYAVRNHELELVKEGDFSSEITDAGLEQDMLGEADVAFVISAIFDRVRHKYGERGVRYAYIEAGHVSQNIYLQGVSLGLGSVSVGAFFDEKVNQLIGVDGIKEAVIYMHAIGTI